VERCEKCGRYNFSNGGCRCKRFTVVHDYGDKEIWAVDEEEAALEYARYYNEESGECSLMNDEIEVEVIAESGDSKKFKVGAEPDIYYSADEVPPNHDVLQPGLSTEQPNEQKRK